MERLETTLIIIRHGQSMGNVEGKFIGITDSPLSPLGIRQAQLTAEYLKDVKIDKVYASNLSRAKVTAEIIAQKHGLNVNVEPDLREIDAGLWEEVEGRKYISVCTKTSDTMPVCSRCSINTCSHYPPSSFSWYLADCPILPVT